MNLPVDLTISAGVIVTILLTIIGWVQMRWSALNERVDRHEGRLISAETALRAMPSRDDLHRMEMSVSAMAGEMKAVSALMSGQRDLMQRMEAVVARHEDHLLKR